MRALPAALLLLGLSGPALAGGRHLLLVGGGERPRPALERFAELAGGPGRARILVITWAGEDPEGSFRAFAEDLAFSSSSVEHAVSTSAMEAREAEFLDQLSGATGVFITGGDQVRITALLESRPSLREALRAKYRSGAVFGGTSAGTAVMSEVMITGEGDFTVIDGAKVQTRRGLGLLDGVITDQHFIRRQRENRLFGLVLAHPDLLGLGVDEDTALLIKDERYAENFGRGQVMVVRARPRGALLIDLLDPGQGYDLAKRKRR